MRFLFDRKFNRFDLISVGFIVGAVEQFNWWWLVVAIPLGMISAIGEDAIAKPRLNAGRHEQQDKE